MSLLSDFYSRINGTKITVVGIGISNTPVIDFLLSHGASVTARDIKPREKLGSLAELLEGKGVKLILGENYLSDISEDMIIKAPGIRCDLPEFVEAQKRGSVLTSEMELFFELCPCRIFAVTGSDGKTTTTTLVYTMLSRELEKKHSGAKVFVGGNIGKPLLPEIGSIKPDDFAVIELSSFQLHTMKRSPYSAAITNVTPNHLNWHRDMTEYTLAKENIFRNPGCERLALNWGNEITRGMASLTDAEVTYFSAKSEPPLDGVHAAIYDDNGFIVRKTTVNNEIKKERLLRISDIKLPGRHNVENYMTSIAVAYGFISAETIDETAREFGGVEHRCEFVRELDGVKYYNSSIDSSPTRTEAALRSFSQKVIAICGGYDKHIPYEPLAKPLIDCAKTVVLVGVTAPKIKAALLSSPEYSGLPEIIDASDFYEAVKAAKSAAKQGDIVILSPASASFDMFKNFEERGNKFKEIVRSF